MSDIKVGWSMKKITPNVECLMAGYTPLRKTKGVHDNIYTKVLAMYNNTGWYFMVVYDLVAIDRNFYFLLKKAIELANIGSYKLTVTATHTHSAPVGTCKTDEGILKGAEDVLGSWNKEYVNYCISQTLTAIQEAMENASSSIIKMGKTKVKGVSLNRNKKDGPADDSLIVVEICNEKKERALIYHFSCHPTVLKGDNQLISKDFPGGVEQYLSEYDIIFFLNGNCGDLSTRFTRKTSSFEQIAIYGEILGEKIKQVMDDPIIHQPLQELWVMEEEIFLKSKKIESIESAKKRIDEAEKDFSEAKKEVSGEYRILEAQLDGAKANLFMAENLKGIDKISVPYQFIRINQLTFMTFPGEIYYELVQKLKNDLNIGIIAYSNGFNFYLTNKNAFDKSYYEALSSPFAYGEGESFVDEISKRIRKN